MILSKGIPVWNSRFATWASRTQTVAEVSDRLFFMAEEDCQQAH